MNELSILFRKNQTYVLPSETDYACEIIVADGVQITLSDPFVSGTRSLNITVGKGACVMWQVQAKSAGNITQSITITVQERGTFEKVFVSEGNGSGTTLYSLVLAGAEARASLVGRIALAEAAQKKIAVEQLHQAPDTTSSVEINAVLDGMSFLDYQGTITVEKVAVRSRAFQEQKNLVLSPGAHVVSVPNLQVLTHEVECGHGSAVAHVNDDHLFYLQSRGLSYNAARYLITRGFLALSV